jgi:hypothetical protein
MSIQQLLITHHPKIITFTAQGRIRTAVGGYPADLQSAAINHSATCAYRMLREHTSTHRTSTAFAETLAISASRRQDSNPRPAVYKTAALPLSYSGKRTHASRNSRPIRSEFRTAAHNENNCCLQRHANKNYSGSTPRCQCRFFRFYRNLKILQIAHFLSYYFRLLLAHTNEAL